MNNPPRLRFILYYKLLEGFIMEKVCPLCNSLTNIEITCPNCGQIMKDSGRVQEFRDSYAPEDELEYENDDCRHVFQCINCHELKNIGIKSVFI